jgi:GNAT superfamily N-acetyltransferase
MTADFTIGGISGGDSGMAPPAEGETRPDRVNLGFPEPSSADDTAFVSTLTNIVNAAYTQSEVGIFKPTYRRTTTAEIASLLRQGLLAVARLSPPSGAATAAVSIGCVLVKKLTSDKGDFALLALDPAHRSGGFGRLMVRFAEDHCRAQGCTIMQVELLVPTGFEHPFKQRIHSWYSRLGYDVVRLGNFNDEYPSLAPELLVQAEYRVYEKKLV